MMRVRIAPRDFEALAKLAQTHNTTISEIVRRLIRKTTSAATVFIDDTDTAA